jgi:D-alanyl-D-alanine carboxypeptidase
MTSETACCFSLYLNAKKQAGELLMKKRILCIALIASVTLCGCQNPSDRYLSYTDTVASAGVSAGNQLTQGDFFAKDLTIVTEEENSGNDEKLTAGASLLVNRTDNKLIYADNVYNKLYPASLTKLLTALIVLKYGELTDMVTISYNASHITESGAKTCGFQEGDVISLEKLLNSMLVYSGNDAAVAIAEHVGGSVEGFAKMMNEEAKRIGAVHSNFVNPNGLHDDNQYTTAYDLYLIFNELLNYDTFENIINTASYTADYKDKDGKRSEDV